MLSIEGWNDGDTSVNVIFYDANHCSSAAIVLLELSNGIALLHMGNLQ
jgi:hypothetical protein